MGQMWGQRVIKSPGWSPFLHNQTSWPAIPDAYWDHTYKLVSSNVTGKVLKCKHIFLSKVFQSFAFAPSRDRNPRRPRGAEGGILTLSRRWIFGRQPPDSFLTTMILPRCFFLNVKASFSCQETEWLIKPFFNSFLSYHSHMKKQLLH